MVGTEILLRAAAAVVGVTFAAALLPAARRSRAALWLAAFLGLVALNQVAETARGSLPDSESLPWFRLASVAASLDPLALYLFAANVRPGAMRRPARVLLVAAPAFALALWGAGVTTVPFVNDRTFAYPAALSLFTATVYVGLLFWALEGMLREPERASWRPLFIAVALLAVPYGPTLAANLYEAYLRASSAPNPPWSYLAAEVGGALLVAGVAATLLLSSARGRADPRQRRAMAWALGGSFFLILLIKLPDLDMAAGILWGAPSAPATALFGRAGAAIRFVLFGAFASTALVRHDALGLTVAQRRRAARLLVALAVVTAGALLIPVVGLALTGATGALTPLDFLLLAGVVLLSQGFRRVVDQLARQLYGVPLPGDAAAAQDAYRRAVSDALSEGRDPLKDEPLRRLREDLGLDETTAALLARIADEGAGGPLREGLSVAGRYRVERFLGAGGSGRAFLAEDATLRRRVVLKEVRDTGDGGDEAALQEARVAGGLASPHVVAVHDAFRRRGAWVLVLEHAEGGSLEDALRGGPLPPERAASLLRDVADGAAAVHAKGIVHGDLKPRNVLLSGEGRARIADFGLARLARGRTAPVDAVPLGTPDYLAPEQRRGDPPTTRSDVFALGLIGRRLFPGAAPAALEPILARATETDPARRYQDAGEMARALSGGFQGGSPP